MASAFVQSEGQSMSGTGAPTINFSSTPIEGNLLIAILLERASSDPGPGSMNTSGYTHIETARLDGGDSTHRRGYSIHYKFAGASEGTNHQGTWDTQSQKDTIIVAEFSGISSYRTNTTRNATTTADLTTWAGPNITTSSGATLIPITFYKGQSASPSAAGLVVSFDSGISTGGSFSGTGDTTFTFAIGLGYGDKSSAGTYSTTTTLAATDTDNRNTTTIMLEFETTGGAPSATHAVAALIGASF